MLSDTVFRRSVLKNITEYRSGSQGILSAVSNGRYAVIDACNALACRGGEPEGINAAVTIPDSYDEKLLKKLIADIDAQCRTCGTHIEDVAVSTSQHIRKPVITASAFGRSSEEMPAGMQKAGGNLDIIASGSIGMSGIMNVLDSHMDEAKKVYADSVINAAAADAGKLSVADRASLAAGAGASYLVAAGDGGIYAALWRLAADNGCGFDINLRDIPVKQEIIEMCELFDINPYELSSTGCMLITAEDGCGIVDVLNENAYDAVVIGHTTKEKAKMMHLEDEVRYLDVPRNEESERFIQL